MEYDNLTYLRKETSKGWLKTKEKEYDEQGLQLKEDHIEISIDEKL